MAVAMVQSVGAIGDNVTSFTVTFTSTTVTGRLFAVDAAVWGNTGIPTITITDNKSNTYTSAVGQNIAAIVRNEIFYVANGTGGTTHIITVTSSNAGSYGAACIREASGVAISSPLDGVTSGSGTSTTPSSGQITTTQRAMVVGSVSLQAADTTITPGASWTQRFEEEDQTNHQTINSVDQVDVVAGNYTATWTLVNSPNWGACIAAFKEASGEIVKRRTIMANQAVHRASYW